MKNKLTKYILYSIVIFCCLANFALAEQSDALPNLVADIYKGIIYSAGTIASISFVVGAIGFLISGGNTGLASSSKERMFGSILGLVILICSHLIMSQINPKLTSLGLDVPVAENIDISNNDPLSRPGVYFYAGFGCDNTKEDPLYAISSISGNSLSLKRSVKIINNENQNIFYGVIVHEQAELSDGGLCTIPKIDESCEAIGLDFPASADVFKINKNYKTSGTKVSFFSEPFGLSKEAHAGFYEVPRENIIYPNLKIQADQMIYNYTGTGRPTQYTNQYKTFQDRPGSIRMFGDYFVAMYGLAGARGVIDNNYCMSFNHFDSKNPPNNLFAQPFSTYANGHIKIGDVYIFPIKQ